MDGNTFRKLSNGRRVKKRKISSLLKAIDENDITYVNNNLSKVEEVDDDINVAYGPGTTLLCRACTTGNFEVVKRLIEKGANVNKKSESGKLPLEIAMDLNHTEVSRFLLQNGAQPLKENFNALHVACSKGQREIAALVLKHGVNPNLIDGNGDGALHHAVRKGRLEICQLLIRSNSDVNRQNGVGNTPVHEACRKRSINSRIEKNILKLLLQNDASREIRNNAGHVPLELCNDEEMIALLKKKNNNATTQENSVDSDEQVESSQDLTHLNKLQQEITEIDLDIQNLQEELENINKDAKEANKRIQVLNEKEGDIRKLLRRKIQIRKKVNQELSDQLNHKNSFVLEIFLNTFLRCFR